MAWLVLRVTDPLLWWLGLSQGPLPASCTCLAEPGSRCNTRNWAELALLLPSLLTPLRLRVHSCSCRLGLRWAGLGVDISKVHPDPSNHTCFRAACVQREPYSLAYPLRPSPKDRKSNLVLFSPPRKPQLLVLMSCSQKSPCKICPATCNSESPSSSCSAMVTSVKWKARKC